MTQLVYSYFNGKRIVYAILFLLLFFCSCNNIRHNRLVNASSPYLKEHADNPVDWHEWGDEALQEAKLSFLQEQDGEKFLPYYWASTVILGNTMKLEETKPTDRIYISVAFGITLVLSIAAFLMRRRKGWTLETN